MLELIERETEASKAGKPSRIILKVNSLIDKEIIDSLYEASQAGVSIDLIVRGICGLVPDMKNLSENIRVRSLLGRYLEHSRIYYFENGVEAPLLYLGSADWMPRNFFRRVEAIFPVENSAMIEETMETLKAYFADNEFAKVLRPSGKYAAIPRRGDKNSISVQRALSDKAN